MYSEVFNFINKETERQKRCIDLIASENNVSENVLKAQGSILTNKYAEGYPGKRYYGGCEFVDQVEILAQEKLKELFGCKYANVQPHSGSQANQSVFLALLNPGDTILGMSLDCGGHLTHGASKNMSGLWFNAKSYGVDSEGYIDYENVRKLALEYKPKLIIAGFSAYSRIIDWQKFKDIADEVGAYLMADIAHVAGLIAAECYPSPIEIADVVTSTTHKTLRGPRGGIVMTNNEEIYKKINSAIFPGLQGGPLMHVIAAKAVCFEEALRPQFKTYIKTVCLNAINLAESLKCFGIKIVSDGTDNHIVLVDLSPLNLTGKLVENALSTIDIICNKNTIPNDKNSPFVTSGIRLGTPLMTTRGATLSNFLAIAYIISQALKMLSVDNNADLSSLKHLVDEVISSIEQS